MANSNLGSSAHISMSQIPLKTEDSRNIIQTGIVSKEYKIVQRLSDDIS